MLPSKFTFSQQSLQDYEDCPRRFFLRYIQKLDWPAVESEPVLEQEHLVDLGYRFHQLIQQALSGIPREAVESTIHEPELLRWWNAFQSLELDLSGSKSFVEESLVAPFENARIMAKFDLLLLASTGEIMIYDWKTTRTKPVRSRYFDRAQTLVYPFVLTLAGGSMTGGCPINPETVEMRYWFPEYPEDTLSFPYSAGQHQQNMESLSRQINEISTKSDLKDFEKTAKEQTCRYCRFRSLCERGTAAGERSEDGISESDDSPNPFELDYDL